MKIKLVVLIIAVVLLILAITRDPTPQPSDGWQELAPLKTGRSEIAAAHIPDKIYVAGGIGFFRTLDSCEVYTISVDSWAPCPDLPYALHHLAMAGNDGTVYAAGGYTALGFTHDENASLWELETDSDEWTIAAKLPEPIGEHALFSYLDNLYLIGGRNVDTDSARLWRYSIAEKNWTELTPMPTARHSFALALAKDELWIMGGRSAALGTKIDRTEIYNFADNSWRSGPNLPVGRGGHIASYLDGNVHVIGGEVFDPDRLINRHDVYNLETQSWSSGSLPPRPRHGATAIAIENTIIMIGGGARPAMATAYSASDVVQSFSIND